MWILAILAALGKLARPPRLDMENTSITWPYPEGNKTNYGLLSTYYHYSITYEHFQSDAM